MKPEAVSVAVSFPVSQGSVSLRPGGPRKPRQSDAAATSPRWAGRSHGHRESHREPGDQPVWSTFRNDPKSGPCKGLAREPGRRCSQSDGQTTASSFLGRQHSPRSTNARARSLSLCSFLIRPAVSSHPPTSARQTAVHLFSVIVY